MVDSLDVDDLVQRQVQLLLMAEQDSFASNGNLFCVLTPLMTQDGQRFTDVRECFPNRGRVWWLVGQEGDVEPARAGALLTAAIEPAPNYVSSNPEKERYQVRRFGSQPGARRWLQVIDAGRTLEIGALLSEQGIPCDRQPAQRVLVLTADEIVGPFSVSRFDPAARRIVLAPPNLGKPVVRAVPRKALGSLIPFERFDLQIYQSSQRVSSAATAVRLDLVHEKHLAALEQQGKLIDAMSDRQVVKWALGFAGFTTSQKTMFSDAVQKAQTLRSEEPEELSARRHERFKVLCSDTQRVAALGEEIAEALSGRDPFKTLLLTHVDALASRRIEDVVSLRKGEVEAAISELENRRKNLARDYDTKKKQQEAQLASEHAVWLASLDARQKEIDRREAELSVKETRIANRLERLIEGYRKESDRVGDDVLAQLPVLKRLGLGGPGSPHSVAAEQEVPAKSVLGPWLDTPRGRDSVTERAFIQQLCDVASARGYSFSEADLIGFHVATKSGTWSVVAGPSGIGKSSLPRLYAEALGIKDEYLKIEVRPDWLDDRDVIGGFNSLSGRFEPGTSGLVDHLIAAREDLARGRGGIYIVCLDEMNLARVEHYFSQFLSVMEEPLGRRVIRLYSRGVEKPGEPYSRYRELAIGDNVRFVGTVNVDDTTHFFSPKVLDRAAVLTLDEADHTRAAAPSLTARELAVRPVHFEHWRSWVRDAGGAPSAARDLVLRIDARLRRLRAGLGHRLVRRVLSFVANAGDLLPAERSMDLAVAQAVLPRIPTHHRAFAEEVPHLLDLLPRERFPKAGRFLEEMRDHGGDDGFFQLL